MARIAYSPPACRAWATAGITVLAIAATSAAADQWRITGGGRPTITYTDNVSLSPPGKEQGSFVFGAEPRIGFTGRGRRYSVDGTYTPSVYFYTDGSKNSQFYNTLDLFGNVEAVERFFYVDGGVNIFQNFISPLGPITVSNSLQTNNRTSTYVYRLNPYFQGHLGAETTYLLRWNNTWTDYSSNALRSWYISEVIGRIGQPSGGGRRYGWQVDYNNTYVKYNNQAPFSSYLGRGILFYQVNPDFQVSGRGGYENNDYPLTKYSGGVYGAGLDWRPTPRTVLNGYWEHRFFGDSYQANFQHRTRLTGWRLTGSRNVTTAAQQLQLGTGIAFDVVDAAFTSRIPDTAQRQQAVQDFLAQTGLPVFLTQPIYFYNNQVLLQDRVEAAFSLFGSRNSLVFTAYWSDQEPISATGATLPALLNNNTDYVQQGASLNYTHQLTHADVSFLALRNRTRYRSVFLPGTVDYTIFRAIFNWHISPRTSWFAGARYQWQDPSNPAYSQFREAAIFGGLNYAYR